MILHWKREGNLINQQVQGASKSNNHGVQISHCGHWCTLDSFETDKIRWQAFHPTSGPTAQSLTTRPRAGLPSWLLRSEGQERRLPCNTELAEAFCHVCMEQVLPLKLHRDKVTRQECLSLSGITGTFQSLSQG